MRSGHVVHMADDAAASELFVKMAGPKDSQPLTTIPLGHTTARAATFEQLFGQSASSHRTTCTLRLCVGYYEGGFYKIRVVLPTTYPYKSPSIGFCTPILVRPLSAHTHVAPRAQVTLHYRLRPCVCDRVLPPLLHSISRLVRLSAFSLLCSAQHPNVDEASGSVCLDVINQTWSPMFDLVNVFSVFLPQLLLYPNPSDPLNRQAAQLLMKDPTGYQSRVREHVRQHASKDFHMGGGEEEESDEHDAANEQDEAGEGEDMEEGETDGADGAEDEEDDAVGEEDDEVLSDCDDLPADEPTEMFHMCH